ncbi:MAG: alkaline phosphatase [Phycisphaerales bacterium]|nr:MAG: alkaline phosphatase [Phycisphaerales bacterium]
MAEKNQTDRRTLLKLSAGAVAIGATGGIGGLNAAHASPEETRSSTGSRKPKNIIFMVADGMSIGVPTLAERFSHLTRNRGTVWRRLAGEDRTVHGLVDMAALDSLVPDSAASSCMWATGVPIRNGMINMHEDGRILTPIGHLAKRTGRALGLVTTTRVTHATPAGFAAQVPSRALEDTIAEQYIGEVDILLGGGRRHFVNRRGVDVTDLTALYWQQGYVFAGTRDELRNLRSPNRIVGLFDDSHLPYTIDHMRDPALVRKVPTLAEMTEVALRSLEKRRDGFLLQVEGGRVDHAAHANDAAALMHDQMAFDDAIDVVMRFVERHPDTLVIMTTDHGNANPGLNGMGSRYRASTESFARLVGVKESFGSIYDRINRAMEQAGEELDTGAMQRVLRSATGIELNNAEADQFRRAFYNEPYEEANNQHTNLHGLLGQLLGNHTGVQFTGVTHTADWVLSMAVGPGAEHFQGMMTAAGIYDRMTDLMNIRHRNRPDRSQREDRRRGVR